MKNILLYIFIIVAVFASIPRAAAQSISAGTVTGGISACAGSASASPNTQQFTVSGSSLTGNITASAPAGFQVSLSAGSGYSSSVTLTQTAGTVNSTVVYVGAVASASTGNISGNVVLTSTGATSQNVAVTGTVYPLPTVNAVANQTVNSAIATTAVNFTGTANTFTWVNDTPGIGLAANGTGNIPSFTAVNTGNKPITATVRVTPSIAPLAYITNYGSNSVSVINTANESVIATIPVGGLPIGIAVSRDGTRAYVANYNDNTVSVINAITNKVMATISAGISFPYCVAVSPVGGLAFVGNRGSENVAVINTASNTVTATIPVGSQPFGITVSPDGSRVYATCTDGLVVINALTNAIISTNPAVNGTGLALSPDGSHLYVAPRAEYNTSITVVNTATNAVIDNIPVDSLTLAGVCVSPDGSRVYVAGSRLTPTPANYFGIVLIVNTATDAIIGSVKFTSPDEAYGISITPDGSLLYVPNGVTHPGTVSLISTTTNTVLDKIQVGMDPVAFGNFITTSATCGGPPATFTITVRPSGPVVAAGAATGTISACAGSASVNPNIQQFTVSGSSLKGNITATAPAGFEVSLSATRGYGSSVTLAETGGSIAGTIVYISSAASASTGTISGNVVLSSPGATSQNIAVTGIIYALPTVNTVPNQTNANGAATTAINFSGTANTFNWVNNTPSIGLPASGTGNIASFTAVNTGSSPVTATITATPQSYPPLAYIPNGEGGIAIINTETHAVISTMPFNGIAFGVAASPNGGLLYCANSGQNTVSVINTTTNTVSTAIPIGTGPSGLALTPDGSSVYVANNSSNSVSVVNTSTNAVVATIPVATAPVGVTVSKNGEDVYVANSASNTIAVISTATNTVVSSIPLPANSYPYYMALSPVASNVLYITNLESNTVSAINTTNNTITATIPVGTHPQGIAVSADGSRLYVTNNGAATVSVINTATNTVVATIGVGNGPSGVAITPDGSQLYVINNTSSTVSIISTASDTVVATITVNGSPYATGNFIIPGGGCTGAPVSFSMTVDPAPVIATTGIPSALSTTYGTPSPSTSFNVSGTNMTAGILVTPPTGFEVSTNNVNFSSTVTIPGNGAIASTPVYIRLAATTPVDTYSGNIILSSAGAASVNVAMPASTVSPASLTISAFNQSKAYGTANPMLTAMYTGFVNGESYTSLTTPPTLSTTASTTSPAGTYPITAIGAVDPNYRITYVAGTLTVVPGALTVTVVDQTKVYGLANPTLTVTYSGFANGDTGPNLTTQPTVTTAATTNSPVGTYIVIASDAIDPNYSIVYVEGTLTITPASLTITADNQTKVSGTPNPELTVSYSGFVNGDTGASLTTQPGVTTTATLTSPPGTYPITPAGAADVNYNITYVTGTLTVTSPPPTITAAGNLSPLNTIYGTPSTATIFTVAGTNMTSGILVTPPAGFEVSTNDITYHSTVTVGGPGTIESITVYIRLAATTPVGTYSGNIVLSGNGASDLDLSMPLSTVSTTPLVITADNKSKIYGEANPILTASYTGFVNGDGPETLTVQPVITTTALTTSPVGQYPITVNGAESPNYSITYYAGILTINPVPPHIVIPNTFTPNGDGINDTWNVKYLDLYPGCSVQIFSRWGQMVFSSIGYGVPWDGTYRGAKLADGTYYYIIDLKNGSNPVSGYVAVIR